MKVAGMCLKSDFSAKVFVLRSMGNELVPSLLKLINSMKSMYKHMIIIGILVNFLCTEAQWNTHQDTHT